MDSVRYYLLAGTSQQVLHNIEEYVHLALLDPLRLNTERREHDGTFDVLYKSAKYYPGAKVVKKKFWKSKEDLVTLELVVKGNLEELLDFQEYFSSSDITVTEARYVSQATLSFTSPPRSGNVAREMERRIRMYLQTLEAEPNRKELVYDIAVSEEPYWEGGHISLCSGFVTGPTEKVLQVRKVIRSMGYGLKQENIIFQE